MAMLRQQRMQMLRQEVAFMARAPLMRPPLPSNYGCPANLRTQLGSQLSGTGPVSAPAPVKRACEASPLVAPSKQPRLDPHDLESEVSAAGTLSLSPLNSPALASCVSLLGTPDLIAVAGTERPSTDPPPLSLAADPAWTDARSSPPCPSPTPGQSTGQVLPSGPTPEHKPYYSPASTGSMLGRGAEEAAAEGKGAGMGASLRPSPLTCLDVLTLPEAQQ